MATLVYRLESPSPTLIERKETLMAAIEERMGILGQQLYDLVAGKLSGGVLQLRTGALLDSVMLSAVISTGVAFETFVEIPEESPQHLIGAVHEYGGQGYYLIEPVNAQALRFVVGGQRVFAKRVNHPPAIERSFMRSSLDEITETVYAELDSVIGEVLEAA